MGEGQPTTPPDWVAQERAQPGAWSELRRLGRRARQRWLRTLLYTLLLTAAAVAFAALRAHGAEPRALLFVAAGVFLVALPVCIIGVGAFDRRIYDADDVRRLGVPVVGVVRRFAGDNVGALVDRLRDETRGRIGPS